MGTMPFKVLKASVRSFVVTECVILKTALIAIVLVPKDGLLQVDHTVLQLCPRGS